MSLVKASAQFGDDGKSPCPASPALHRTWVQPTFRVRHGLGESKRETKGGSLRAYRGVSSLGRKQIILSTELLSQYR